MIEKGRIPTYFRSKGRTKRKYVFPEDGPHADMIKALHACLLEACKANQQLAEAFRVFMVDLRLSNVQYQQILALLHRRLDSLRSSIELLLNISVFLQPSTCRLHPTLFVQKNVDMGVSSPAKCSSSNAKNIRAHVR